MYTSHGRMFAAVSDLIDVSREIVSRVNAEWLWVASACTRRTNVDSRDKNGFDMMNDWFLCLLLLQIFYCVKIFENLDVSDLSSNIILKIYKFVEKLTQRYVFLGRSFPNGNSSLVSVGSLYYVFVSCSISNLSWDSLNCRTRRSWTWCSVKKSEEQTPAAQAPMQPRTNDQPNQLLAYPGIHLSRLPNMANIITPRPAQTAAPRRM